MLGKDAQLHRCVYLTDIHEGLNLHEPISTSKCLIAPANWRTVSNKETRCSETILN